MPAIAKLTSLSLLAAILAAGTAASAASPGASASANCKPSLFSPPASPGYANTTWPTEHRDAWRTHAAPTGLSRDVGRLRLHTAIATLPPVPNWGYVGAGDNVYVLGGAPYLLDTFTALMQGAPPSRVYALVALSKLYARSMTPYIARINTKTMRVSVLSLPKGTSANYTGGALVHANGYLYTVARSVLYKIDPSSFKIVASKLLPLAPDSSGAPNQQTAYNGIVATSSGDLILKGWASTGGGDLPPGILLRVNPADLTTKAESITADVSAARMAIVNEGGKEYLYLPNTTQSVRFLLGSSSFTVDTAWSATYLLPGTGDTTASSDIFVGAGVVFANNTDFTATAPMSVFAQGSAVGAPIQRSQAFTSNGADWNFFMMAADPFKSGMAAVLGQNSGHLSGFLTCAGGQSVKKVWENNSIKASAGIAINYKAGQLYTDDRTCKGKKCKLYLVVLDLRTGRELARTAVAGTKPSMGQIFIGPDAVYYVASDTRDAHGYVTRVTTSRRSAVTG